LTEYLKGDIDFLAIFKLQPVLTSGESEAPGSRLVTVGSVFVDARGKAPILGGLSLDDPRGTECTMKTRAVWVTVLVVVVILFLGASAEAQLPKEGKYTSVFGWTFNGKVMEIEKEYLFIYGEYVGTNFNDEGKGFLHQTALVCSGSGYNLKGVYKGAGDCVVTDKDGDKALLVWSCEGGPRCDGEFQWTGGTGKFAGIKGKTVFNGGGIGNTNQGFTTFKGEWRLP
jgi:hypothetical protein